MAVSNNSVTVGNSTTQVVPAREQRIGLTLTNDSGGDIYIAIGENAQMNKGIKLASGAGFVIEEDDKVNLPVNAISASGGLNLAYFDHYLDEL